MRNLLGRRGISALRLNWNKIFKLDKDGDTFQTEEDHLEFPIHAETSEIRIPVIVNGKRTEMTFDSGAGLSKMHYHFWMQIGKPNLDKNIKSNYFDAGNNPIGVEGHFLAEVRFPNLCKGVFHDHPLPLLVTKEEPDEVLKMVYEHYGYPPGIFGLNWINGSDLDMNEIFNRIK